MTKHEPVVKLTFCLRRRSDWDEEEFHRYWLEEHGPLVRSFKNELNMLRYVQVHNNGSSLSTALAKARGAPDPYDGIAEMYWRDRAEMERALASKEGRDAGRVLLEDERKFIDLSRSPIWLNEVFEVVNEDQEA